MRLANIKEKLEEEIKRSMKTVQPAEIRKQSDLSICIRNEMCISENGGMRGRYLELVYGY